MSAPPVVPYPRWFVAAGIAVAGLARAGEIIILQPTPPPAATEARQEARRAAGKPVAETPIILVDPALEGGGTRPALRRQAEHSAREAREYLEPPPALPHEEGTTVILRAVPPTDAERARLRARAEVTPAARPAGTAQGKNCTATSDVGLIGEGPDARRGNVSQQGISSVSTSCR